MWAGKINRRKQNKLPKSEVRLIKPCSVIYVSDFANINNKSSAGLGRLASFVGSCREEDLIINSNR